MSPRSRAPRAGGWLWLPASGAILLCVVPLLALATRVSWSTLLSDLTSDVALSALWLSIKTATLATVLAALLGIPLAWLLSQSSGRSAHLVRACVLVPMVLPPVVGGIVLLATFGRFGLLGSVLNATGWQIVFTTSAVVIAQTFVSMPFLIISLEGAMRQYDTRYHDVAATLGARPTFTFRTVWLPLLAPSLRAGLVVTFARAVGEFGATMTFAGSLPGVTRTLPLEIYLQREDNPQRALALSVILVVVALVTVAITRTRKVESRA